MKTKKNIIIALGFLPLAIYIFYVIFCFSDINFTKFNNRLGLVQYLSRKVLHVNEIGETSKSPDGKHILTEYINLTDNSEMYDNISLRMSYFPFDGERADREIFRCKGAVNIDMSWINDRRILLRCFKDANIVYYDKKVGDIEIVLEYKTETK